jgi:hypothetical protein
MNTEDSIKLVNQELKRSFLYRQILNAIQNYLSDWNHKEIQHLLLRFIFNRKIEEKNDDPVFVIGSNSSQFLANEQLISDIQFKYGISHKTKESGQYLCNMIDHYIRECKNSLLKIESLGGNLMKAPNKNEIFDHDDGFKSLLEKYPQYPNHAIALHIRYNYMGLKNHGLARNYKDDTKLNPNEGVECFASSFNHYFDEYYSAFPDLESVFGSRGNFFTADLIKNISSNKKFFINPPFDCTIILEAVNQVESFLNTKKKEKIASSSNSFSGLIFEFEFTIPDWKDFKAKEILLNSVYLKNAKKYSKGSKELQFIDKTTNKTISPCDIVIATLIC